MRNVLLAAAAAALMASPALAQELKQTPGSNVTVTQCSAHQHATGYPGHPWIDPYGVYHSAEHFPVAIGYLAITYRNDKGIPAKEVEFGLVARNSLIAVAKDAGTFAPGVSIAHEFSVDPEIFPIGTQFPYCAVMRIKYADGSEWRNPNPPD